MIMIHRPTEQVAHGPACSTNPRRTGIGHQAPAHDRRPHAAPASAGEFPDQGAEDSTAVERKARHRLNTATTRLIRPSQVSATDSGSLMRSAAGIDSRMKNGRQGETDRRAGDGDPEFVVGRFRILADLGHAAEDEQRDGLDRHAAPNGDQAVAQFMGDDAGKEHQHRGHGQWKTSGQDQSG
jgi:hypothetical protein